MQAEGGEQGDPLMPLLFSIAIQGALEEVAATLERGEQLCAFLYDVYLLCRPNRVTTLFTLLRDALERRAGVQLHQGKTKVWNKSGRPPEDVRTLGRDTWQPAGIRVLGTPIGTAQFVAEAMEARIVEERRLWEAIPSVPDLQCAWQTLVQSANPRANHTLRTLPPSECAGYAEAHDAGMWNTAAALLRGVLGTDVEREHARQVATLPMRMGGLGLRSAQRCSTAVYWASWADALPMIGERNPEIAAMALRSVEGEPPQQGCLTELQQPTSRLDREGFGGGPRGRRCSAVRDHPRTPLANQVSGDTAGNTGHLLSLTSGRGPFCLSVPRLAKLTFVPTQEPMPAQR